MLFSSSVRLSSRFNTLVCSVPRAFSPSSLSRAKGSFHARVCTYHGLPCVRSLLDLSGCIAAWIRQTSFLALRPLVPVGKHDMEPAREAPWAEHEKVRAATL